MDIIRGLNSLRIRGIRGTINRIQNGPDGNNILKFWNFIVNTDEIPFCEDDFEKYKNEQPVLNWVVPEMGKGSGGHTTIFRFMSFLENHGIHNRLYIDRPMSFQSDKQLKDFLWENFPVLDHKIEIYYSVDSIQFAHGTVATGWQTAYYVRRFNNTISKFYFVQDFEPYFYAHGSEFEFAENTYKFGFRGITAGAWLRDICQEYGMTADDFSFSYDKEACHPKKKMEENKRVFFYARPVTPRRDFELGMLALNELCRKMPEVEVIFAGWNIGEYIIPFKHTSYGIVSAADLYDLYSMCDLCLVLSNTNLSLVPLEVMGAGSVAVCSKGPNSEWMLNDENSILVDYDPIQIAEKMEWYLKHPDSLEKIRNQGLNFAQSTSWVKEGEIVKSAVLKGIEEDTQSILNNKKRG